MIEVIIKDTETNTSMSIDFTTESLKDEWKGRVSFFNQVHVMIGEFLRDLREQWKEEKP